MNIVEYLEGLSRDIGRRARVGFFGLGISNMALIRALPRGYPFTVRSDAAELVPCILPEKVYLGARALAEIDEDVLFLSPSTRRDRPELIGAQQKGARLMSDCELFFTDEHELYAVTGSDGKSTTSTLAKELLPNSALVGNIGVPFTEAPISERYVAELSSFQLEYCVPRARRAILTSLSENHLNWHTSYEEYREAKLSLLRKADEAVIPISAVGEVGDLHPYAVFGRMPLDAARGLISAEHYITLDDGVIAYDGEPQIELLCLQRREWYNIENFMGAVALSSGLCTRGDIVRLGESFTGLSHRAELFFSVRGRDFINSSIDTTPKRCSATLEALGRRVFLILGGRGKGLSPDCMLPAIKKYAEGLALYGEAGLELLPYITDLGVPAEYYESFFPAVDYAVRSASEGSAILLSPAATGYGEFASFAERGDAFKAYIRSKFRAEGV